MVDQHLTWKEAHGDETYALNWDIDADSRVWEIGGFEGRWAAQMVEKYNPYMEIFEPQMWAVERLRVRFAGMEKVTIHPWGLWFMPVELPIYRFGTDGASVIKQYTEQDAALMQAKGRFRDVYEYVRQVDVCLMNIEGAEWALLPYLLGMDVMRNFRYFWCQFHTGLVDGADQRYEIIKRGLSRTHRMIWEFYPTAVAWERK